MTDFDHAADLTNVSVQVVPALSDNFMYLISSPPVPGSAAPRSAAVIDPVEPEKLLALADEIGVSARAH